MAYGVAGIYCILNKANGKRYVGQTTNLHRRRDEHWDHLRKGTHKNKPMQEDWDNQHGRDFAWFMLEIVDDIALLNEREQYWMDHLNTWAPNGYNILKTGYTMPKNWAEKRSTVAYQPKVATKPKTYHDTRGSKKKGYGSN